MPNAKSVHRIVVEMLFIFALVAFCTRAILGTVATTSVLDKKHGAEFDFTPLRDARVPWSGPRIGERIDLGNLKGRDGATAPGLQPKNLLLLAVVDPRCPLASHSTKYLRDIITVARNDGVEYIFVSFSNTLPEARFFEYASSLDPTVKAFVWNKNISPERSLALMVAPSHLLVKRDGVVIQTWPGTSASPSVQQAMVRQITADIFKLALLQGLPGQN